MGSSSSKPQQPSIQVQPQAQTQSQPHSQPPVTPNNSASNNTPSPASPSSTPIPQVIEWDALQHYHAERAGGVDHRAGPFDFMYAAHRNPCFRQSMQWGLGIGAAMSLHSAYRYRDSFRSVMAGSVSFCAVSLGMWTYCRYQQQKENKMFREVMRKVAEKQDRERRMKQQQQQQTGNPSQS